MPQTRNIISVGVDIGTTTTQVVFSQLTLMDVARSGQIPRIDITERKVLYESQIFFTPLIDFETIDASRLAIMMRGIYESAGVVPQQVETGAVIITGETAKKKNADEILQAISGLAGDFVVTVAGPHVESMVAGRGSGAAAYSRQHFTTVTNVDIGGGSANSAIFRQGNMVAAAAMNYGGRIIEIDHGSSKIRHLAQPAKVILEYLGLRYKIGDQPQMADLERFTNCMADLTIELIEGTASPLAQKLYLTAPSPISGQGTLLMLSGGIGYYFYHPVPINSISDVTVHDDIGPLLGQSLRLHQRLRTYRIERPAETMRATVLGASSQLVALSGSTIWAEEGILPLKNLPVIRLGLDDTNFIPEKIASSIQSALERWDVHLSANRFAIALEFEQSLDYSVLVQIAKGLGLFSAHLPPEVPLVVVIKHDYARALGQTVRGLVSDRPLLVIDQVGLEEGDFIDIGVPIMDGRVVPLSVKTLVFYH